MLTTKQYLMTLRDKAKCKDLTYTQRKQLLKDLITRFELGQIGKKSYKQIYNNLALSYFELIEFNQQQKKEQDHE